MSRRARSAPTTRRRGTIAATALIATVALALTGCSAGNAPTGTTTGAKSGGFPVSLTNTFGTTTIPAKPKRVATVSWTNQDVAVALGDVPVSMPSSSYGDDNGDGILPWTYKGLKGLGDTKPALHDETDGIPYEKIADATPDVVLGAYSGLTKDEYTTLGKIAPTVSYPKQAFGTAWRQTTMLDGEALGQKAQAKKLVDATDAKITAAAKAHPQLAGKTVMYLWIDPKDLKTITYYTPNDPRVQFLNDLGLKTAPSITKLSKGSTQFSGTVSSEEANTLDADIAVIYVDDAASYKLITKDPLLSQIPAVKRGSVALLTNTTMIMATSAPSVLSIPWALPKYVPLLADAADKVK